MYSGCLACSGNRAPAPLPVLTPNVQTKPACLLLLLHRYIVCLSFFVTESQVDLPTLLALSLSRAIRLLPVPGGPPYRMAILT